MSSITSIDSSTTTSTTGYSSLSSLTTEDFLKLLLTELENQDPTDPMDTSEMTSMFCSLTQVTQAEETNEYLASLLDCASSAGNSQAVSYIGKTITYTDSSSAEATAQVSGVEYEDGTAWLVTGDGTLVDLSSVTQVTS